MTHYLPTNIILHQPSVNPKTNNNCKHIFNFLEEYMECMGREGDRSSEPALQIALFVLGNRRKRNVSIVDGMILWFAYQTKDWVTIAALGKFSNSMQILPPPLF
ncbi:hypothetical protein SLA2020_061440 [Shorea laevis]